MRWQGVQDESRGVVLVCKSIHFTAADDNEETERDVGESVYNSLGDGYESCWWRKLDEQILPRAV